MNKIISFLGLVFCLLVGGTSQLSAQIEYNWHLLDISKDELPGVSAYQAEQALLNKLELKPVIVAVIDGGVEADHEDLKNNMWVNEDEIPGNGIDDDKNGYVDDIYGWNFIGGKDSNVNKDTYELTRLYKYYSDKYRGKNEQALSADEKKEFQRYKEIEEVYLKERESSESEYKLYKGMLEGINNILKVYDGVELTADTLKSYKPQSREESMAWISLYMMLSQGQDVNTSLEELESAKNYFKDRYLYGYNTDFNPRSIVGDDYNNPNDRFYGNADVEGPDGMHGTHVAGIIAAARNEKGAEGIAPNARIMAIRAVPNGDERDKDVANAIRYAVDNGASIINMSFGKSYSYNKTIVDEAVKYAESKDVLLVHAAGNDAQNIDKENNFPNDHSRKKNGLCSNWLEVGASSWAPKPMVLADFTNYGRKSVDLFAPGVSIYSTVPDQKYKRLNGTSMAAPVASGVAAVIRGAYPSLTAAEVKEVLIKSSTRIKGRNTIPGKKSKKRAKRLSQSGGLLNLYEALEMASTYVK
jgi:cell wall-associated protease